MPAKDFLIWLVAIISVVFLALFPLLVSVINGPVETWHLIIILNILFPAVLWYLVKSRGYKETDPRRFSHAKLEDNFKVPGLELKIPILPFSLLLGFLIALPGIYEFGKYYRLPSYLTSAFFDGITHGLFLVWGISFFLILYTYLRSRNVSKDSFLSFQIHSPILGAVFGIIGSVQILFMILQNYLPVPVGSSAAFQFWLFRSLFLYTGMDKVAPIALVLVFGIFLIELTVILSVHLSRRSGLNKAAGYNLLAKDLAIAVIFYSALLLFILSLFIFLPVYLLLGL